ncbi:hypothetical protein CCACVL1_14030 [Corchorus capsularis]|uniref:BHLH domain-containing protein n=1 Tax=Corchorus capsularis TaxID=210143 RepID=A0A1R3I8I3_COCAP|nr:hypothetical protein CCACVL1_14030 [Corchorus capsularis]
MEVDRAVGVAAASQKRSRNGGTSKNGKAANGGDQSEHEMHIWTERERRKKMRNMFSNLHALLPQLSAKADKSTIVDEAVTYIKSLQQTLQTLQKQKLEKLRSATMADSSSIITPHQVQANSESNSRESFLADHVQAGKPSNNNYPMSSNIIDVPQTLPAAPISPTSSGGFQTWFSPNVVINMCGDNAQISVCTPRKPGILSTILYILEKHHLELVSAHISSDQHRNMYMIHVHGTGGASTDQFSEALSVEETFKLAAGEMNLWLLSS